MTRTVRSTCIFIAILSWPIMAYPEIGVLKYTCDAFIVAEHQPEGPPMNFYVGNCILPSLLTAKHDYIVPDEKRVQREAIRQQTIAEADQNFKKEAHIVYEKKDVDDLFVRKADFSAFEKKWNDTKAAMPALLGENIELSIKANMAQVLKALITNDEQFRNELSEILKK